MKIISRKIFTGENLVKIHFLLLFTNAYKSLKIIWFLKRKSIITKAKQKNA